MWIYDKTGRRVNATEQNARDMVEHCEHSALWPKGGEAEEKAELDRQAAADRALIPEEAPPGEEKSPEVHMQRRHHRASEE